MRGESWSIFRGFRKDFVGEPCYIHRMAISRILTTGLLLSAMTIPGCGLSSIGNSVPTAPTASLPTPAQHLDELVKLMSTEAANAGQVNWAELRAELQPVAANARTIADTYPAIATALQRLDDFESHYLGMDRMLIGPSPEPACRPSLSEVPTLPPAIGYVRLEGCPCSRALADAYAEEVQRQIRLADKPGLVGWIVDLRVNGGGNMWPMIAGLGPIFGEQIIGYIIYNNRDYEREYRGGAALSLDEPFSSVVAPYTLIQPSPKVAVLTAETTNSAGEAITVYFKNRPNTRSFGAPTCGHHHLLQTFGMSNGAALTLKTAHNADRLKRTYAGAVLPDEMATGPGEAVAAAVAWLQQGR